MTNETRTELSVIVPVYSRNGYLAEMLERLFLAGIRLNAGKKVELVIIDDASPLQAQTAAAADEAGRWADVVYHRNSSNLGYLRSANKGLTLASGKRLLLCNSDTRLVPGALARMEAAMDSDPGIGMVGPVSNGAFGSVMQCAAAFPSELLSFGTEELARFDNFGLELSGRALPPVPASWLMGFCTLLRREVLENTGLLDEGFGFGYLEEVDYGIRARRAGWTLAIIPDAFVFHGGLRKGGQVAGRNSGSQTGRTFPLRTLVRILKGYYYLKKKYGKQVIGIPQDLPGTEARGF